MRPALIAVLLAAARPSVAEPPRSVAACLESAALQPRTVFEVSVSTFPTIVSRRLSIPEINRLRPIIPPPKTIAHGYSVAQYRLRYTVKSEATCWQVDGHTCAWLGGVIVDLTPDAIRVYIPKEYAADSCESRALILHEMEHEQLHRRRLLETVEKMRRALTRAQGLPGPRAPINASSPLQAYSELKSKVDQVVRPIYEGFLEAIEKEEAGLDDAEHYRRLGESCPDWKRT